MHQKKHKAPKHRTRAGLRSKMNSSWLPGLFLIIISISSIPPLDAQIESHQSSELISQQALNGAQHQEILVQPNSQVRIECKLPQLAPNDYRLFYWNFLRTAARAAKPYTICFETKCQVESAFGIQLEADRQTGSYDLVINNATYELNDGLYYCDYTDTSPESKQTINREYRLTVLSKYNQKWEFIETCKRVTFHLPLHRQRPLKYRCLLVLPSLLLMLWLWLMLTFSHLPST